MINNIALCAEVKIPTKPIIEKQYAKGSKITTLAKMIGGNFVVTFIEANALGFLNSNDVCLKNLISQDLTDNITKLQSWQKKLFIGCGDVSCENLSEPPMSAVVLQAPVLEEIQFRLLFQEILLKRVPKYLLNKISPKHTYLIDSKIAKITRVLISSSLFALMHKPPRVKILESETLGWLLFPKLDCSNSNQMIAQFIGGIYLGILQETTGNVAYPIFIHMFHNSLGYALTGG